MKASKRILLLTIVSCVFAAVIICGCARMSQEEVRTKAMARLDDQSKSLWINVNSVPSGAKVYGSNNGQPGTMLGTTPLTLKYTWVPGRGLWGMKPDETLTFEARDSWFLVDHSKSYAAFKCIIIKDNYHPYKMYQTIIDESDWGLFAKRGWDGIIEAMENNQKTFTAYLQPISTVDYSQPVQQQQQTVIIPDYKEKKEETGIILVSSNIEGTDVYVDGIFVGNSPCELPLTEGIHIIEAKYSGYKPYRREIRVMSGGKAAIRVNLEQK